jgi:hypothetical protein
LSGWEPFLNAISKYSWRTFFGVFVASGAILFFPGKLGVRDWAQPLRGYLVAAFILSGAVLLTHLATTVHASVQQRHAKRTDLRMVAGTPLHANWSVSTTPVGKKPMLILMCTMNFAHNQGGSVHIKRAYLKGTREEFPMSEIVVEGPYDPPASVCIGLSPVKAKPGKELVGRLIFVDQFNGKYVSEKITFRPNTIPSDMRANQLKASPNCVFCNKPVDVKDQAAAPHTPTTLSASPSRGSRDGSWFPVDHQVAPSGSGRVWPLCYLRSLQPLDRSLRRDSLAAKCSQ